MVSLKLLKKVILDTLLRKYFKGTNVEAKSSIRRQLRGGGGLSRKLAVGEVRLCSVIYKVKSRVSGWTTSPLSADFRKSSFI